MKNAPLILITPSTQSHGVEFLDHSLSLSDRYPGAIVAAGGIPWIMPCLPKAKLIAECVRRCDGVMLTGGDDIQPKVYRSSVPRALAKTVGETSARRDSTELLVIEEIIRQRKPLLAICRGMQLLNVALGGSLIVDIASQLPNALHHNRLDRKDQLVHAMSLAPDSNLKKIFGKLSVSVNSSHHQAVDRLGRGLRVTGRAADGVAEGVEWEAAATGRRAWMVGVQFHPERLWERHPEFAGLFGSFVNACS